MPGLLLLSDEADQGHLAPADRIPRTRFHVVIAEARTVLAATYEAYVAMVPNAWRQGRSAKGWSAKPQRQGRSASGKRRPADDVRAFPADRRQALPQVVV